MHLRVERRPEVPRMLHAALPLISTGAALIVTALLLLATGRNPIETYRDFWEATFSSAHAVSATLATATPILFTGLAAAFAFRIRAWNIGAEGQLYVGAACAAAAGFAVGSQGTTVAIASMIAAGTVGGALWALVPGVLRAYLNTNEILTTLMLNYVAAFLLSYLIISSTSYLRDTSPTAFAFPQSKRLDESAYWPEWLVGDFRVPATFILGALLALGLWLVVSTTRIGYQMRVISQSVIAGRYAGMRVGVVFVCVMVASGAVAGLGGASYVGSFAHAVEPQGLVASAYGYTGIVVAALARLNPLGVVVAAIGVGALTNAGFALQGDEFPLGLVGTMIGIILFSVLGVEAAVNYKIRLSGRPRVPAEARISSVHAPRVVSPATSKDPGEQAS